MPFPAVLHCFSSAGACETAIALGHYVSFSGILTFKNSQEIRDIARDLPADRILVETDAPFLAPAPGQAQRAGLCREHRRGAGRRARRIAR